MSRVGFWTGTSFSNDRTRLFRFSNFISIFCLSKICGRHVVNKRTFLKGELGREFGFLDASMHLYKRLCPSGCWSVTLVLFLPGTKGIEQKRGHIRDNWTVWASLARPGQVWASLGKLYSVYIYRFIYSDTVIHRFIHLFISRSISQSVGPSIGPSLVLPLDGCIVVCFSDLLFHREKCQSF